MPTFAATVLGLVFLDEVAVMGAFGYAGSRVGAFPLNIVLMVAMPAVAMLVWFFFASPGFSAVSNALAQTPPVAALLREMERAGSRPV